MTFDVNDDGTVLQSEELAWGETPVYHGETPTKESTAQYEFTFSGWNPAAFSPVSGDATYTAEYTETVRTYTIRFIYEDGVVHETLQLKYGDYPLCKEDPYRNGTMDYEVRPVRTLVTEDFDYTLHCVADDVDFDPLTNKTDKDLGKSGIENLFWGQVDSDHQQITLTDGDLKSGIPGVGLSNNPDGLSSMPDGSTVQLQWIEKPESTLQSLKESGKIRPETLNSFYDDQDDGQKFWLFQLNAYDTSGKKLEQNDFQSTMEVYIELGDDWDIEDIDAIYLDNDEILEKPEIVYKDVNGVMKRFAVLRLEHFSTYAVILRGTFGSNPQQEQY